MPGDIAKEIDALQQMTTSELADRYEELHGQPVRTRHRAYLIRKVAWRIQANAEGDTPSLSGFDTDSDCEDGCASTIFGNPRQASRLRLAFFVRGGQGIDARGVSELAGTCRFPEGGRAQLHGIASSNATLLTCCNRKLSVRQSPGAGGRSHR